MIDHVHMLISIPPKFSVSQVVGFIRARVRSTLRGPPSASGTLSGSTFGRGGTGLDVGRDEAAMVSTSGSKRRKIKRVDQLPLLSSLATFRWLPIAAHERRQSLAASSGSQILKPPALPGDTVAALCIA